MSAQLQRGLGWSRPLLSFKVKILFDDFTYYDDNDDTETDTMMDVVYEVGSDDDWFWIFINCPVQMWNSFLCLCPYMF